MAETKRNWRLIRRTLWGLTFIGAIGGGGAWWWYSHTAGYHWKKAGVSLTANDWATAEIHLQNVIAVAPDDVTARVALANALFELEKKLQDQPPVADPPRAIEQLVEVARLQPKNTAVRERLLRNYLRTERADAAATMAQELAALGTTNGDALYLAANAALSEKRWANAEQVIERFGEKVTLTAPLYLSLKVRLLEGQDDREALDNWLGPTVRQLSQASDLGRQPLSVNERRALGAVLVAAVRCSPRDAAERRLLNSLTILEKAAMPDKEPVTRSEFVEIAARLCGVMNAVHSQPLAATKTNNPAETRRTAMQKLLRFAEPTLKAGHATPLVYEQLARAASLLGDDLRAITLLQQGIEQHRQLPEERQRELLALQWQSAVRLVMQRRFAEAAKHTTSLLEHSETKPLGQLLAGAMALEEGRLEAAQQHLAELAPPTGVKRGVVIQALRLRVQLAAREWAAALERLQEFERDWDTLSPAEAKWLTETQGGRELFQWRQAFCLFALNQPEPARELLQALDAGPLRAKARLLRIVDLVGNEQRKEAWDVLRLARREAPQDFDLLMTEFSLLLQDGATDGATRLLTSHVQRQPRDLPARLALARWWVQRGDVPAALRELSETRRLFPNAEAPCLLAANLLLTADRGDEFKSLLQAMQRQPALAKLVPLLQAQWNLRRVGLTEAADALQQADSELQRGAAFKITAAEIAFEQKDASLAFEHLADSLEFTGTRALIHDGFLKAFAAALQTADPKSMSDRVEQLLTKYPNEPVVLLASAEIAARRNDDAAAMERIDRLEKVEQTPGQAPYVRARLFAMRGRIDDALTEVNRAIAATPQYAAARLFAAQLQFSRHEHSQVLEHLAIVPLSLAERIDVVLLRAESLVQLKRSPEAQTLLEDLIRKQPQQSQPYLSLATLHETSKNSQPAVETIKRGLAQLPQQPQLQAALLTLLVRSGQVADAAESAQRFAGSSPNEAECLRLARVFLAAQQFDTAGVWLQRAREVVKVKPSIELLFLDALLSQQTGTHQKKPELFAEARQKYDVLLQQSPGYIPALNNLAWLLVQELNQPAEAFAVAEQLRAEIPQERLGTDVLDTLAEVYRRSGHEREALDLLGEAVTRFPNSAILRYQHAAALLATSGDDSQPRELARQELALAKQWGVPAHRSAELNSLLKSISGN